MNRNNDTIVALASNPDNSAISIIRISGAQSHDCFLQLADFKNPLIAGHFYKTKIYDKQRQIIDEIIFLVYKNSRSYTGENMIEINCHGGKIIAQKIIENLIISGCKYAKPGEFT